MTDIIAAQTSKTPEISFDTDTNTLRIVGKSYPEDLYAFWQPVTDQVQTLLNARDTLFTFEFALTYHNSGTTRVIINFIKDAERILSESSRQIRIKWYFDPEDEQTEEQGGDYRDLCDGVTFELIGQEVS
jgi:hypothetical protein